MSGRSYAFFPRQTLLQEGNTDTLYYSETFDLQAETSFMLEMRPYAVAGTTPSIEVFLQTSNTLHAADAEWTDDLAFPAVTSGGGAPIRVFVPSPGQPLGRYGRVMVKLTGTDVGYTFEVLGIARSD